jgi:3-hydroxyacyl-CoA dehydrogenase
LRAAAIKYARSLLATGKGPRRTGEMEVDRATATDEIFHRLAEQARKLYPNRNAALVAVEAVRKGSRSSFAQGLESETELVNECKKSVESRGAVHVFFAERESRRVPGMGEEIKATPVKSAAVIGAGTMGGGIAVCFANAGIPVTLVDATAAALERGLAGVERVYQSMVERGRLTPEDKAQRMALIGTTLDYEQLRTADVIIEAVFESMDLKREVFAKPSRGRAQCSLPILRRWT